MQFAICRSAENAAKPLTQALERQRLRWLRFGHDVFCYPADPAASVNWSGLELPGARLNVSGPGPELPRTGSVYLVTQEGRSFQRAHPDIPVLLHKGRHLLVSLDQKQLAGIAAHPARFSIEPAPANGTVVETLERPAAMPRVDDRIKRIVDNLSRTEFKATLTALGSMPTRHSLSDHFRRAANDLRGQLSGFGYQASLQDVPIAGGTTLNVIAEKRGLGGGDRSVTMITAHLDSINHPHDGSPENPAAPAPGADDNGSGSAGVIEIARVLKDMPIGHDLRLILFGGEEQGLFGSKRYLAQLPAQERQRITSVVNMDMIAVANTQRPSVLLEGGDQVSRPMIGELSSAAHTYTQLTVDTSFRPHDSDHVPFIDAGVPAALTIEGNDEGNENVHSANDTLNHINYDLAMEILRMNTAFVAGRLTQE